MKNINAMQGFGSMDILCVDKTGTLTGDRISLEYYMDILGNENQAVLDLAYINSCYHTGVQNHLDAALLKCREMPGKGDHFQQLSAQHPKLDELPFDYDRKFASVLVKGTEKSALGQGKCFGGVPPLPLCRIQRHTKGNGPASKNYPTKFFCIYHGMFHRYNCHSR